MSKDYGSWSVADLKSELRKRNAKVTGKKAVLVQRLQDYDALFGNIVNDPEAAYIISVPDSQYFRDINSDTQLPILDDDDLDIFSIVAERDDMDTSKKMYMENFLLSARLACSQNQSGEYFVVGTCASEMRKQVVYNVTIKYEEHTIIETQCECAAGMGPYAQCKHILTLLYGLIDFCKNKTINIRKTCTEVLQSFHRPSKFYTGEPVETENLTLKIENRHLKNITNFDPRPANVKNVTDAKFEGEFKMRVSNFCSTEKAMMPIAHIIKPADKRALFRDHDYLEKTHEETFLESLILDKNDLEKLQHDTMHSHKLWKEQRLVRLQSCNFGKICKCKEETKITIAKSLLKNTNVVTASTKYGLKYEEQAVKAFSVKTGLETTKCGIVVHEELQFLGCTPDRLVGEEAVLEVKCPYSATRKQISPETVPYVYLCDQTGELKLNECHEYFYQVQGQLFCTQRKRAYFCIYTITDICVIIIDRNESFIKTMIQKLKDFYNDYYKNMFLRRYLYKIKI